MTNHAPQDKFDVIPGEDPAELEAVVRSYRAQFNPAGPVESHLVHTLIECEWRNRRISRAENQLLRILTENFKDHSEPLGAAYEADANGKNILKTFHRQRLENERSYYRALGEIESYRQQREPAQNAAPQPGIEVPSPTSRKLGFVPSTPDSLLPAAENAKRYIHLQV